MKNRLVLLLACLAFSIHADSINIYSAQTLKKVVQKLKNSGAEYDVIKAKKTKRIFYLLVANNKIYRNKKIKRSARIFLKRKKYFVQLKTLKLSRAKEEYGKLYERGVKQKDIRIIQRVKKVPFYIVTYEIPEKTRIDEESWTENFSLSQSSFLVDYQSGMGKGLVNSSYIDLLIGGLYEEDSLTLKASARYESFEQRYNLLSVEGKNLGKEKSSKSYLNFDESYFNIESNNWSLTGGKQLFSWGVFDELSFFDRVNLKNADRFVFDYGQDFRRPISAIRLQYLKDNSKLDMFVDFGTEEGRLPAKDSIWTGVDQENGKLRGADLSQTQQALFKNTNIHTEKRSSVGYGLRVSHDSDWGDISLNYLDTYSDQFTLKFSDKLQQELVSGSTSLAGLESGVIVYFPREKVYGFDYANNIGMSIWKVELAVIDNFTIIEENFATTRIRKTSSSLGQEIEFESFSSRIYWQYTLEGLEQEDLWGNKKYERFFWQFSHKFLDETLEVGLRQIYLLSDSSYYSNIFFDYEFTDEEKLNVGFHGFTGDEKTFFGHHENDDFLNLKFTKLF